MDVPLSVLVVEDSEDDALLLVRHLEKGGFHLRWERVETEAVLREALTRSAWDLVISDYRLPAFDGLQALDILKDSGLDIPFLLVSGSIGEERAVEAMRRGAADYIFKDNLSRLLPAVQRELREAEGRRKRREAEAARKALEARLKEAEKLETIGLIAGGMAHEVRNPLFAIQTVVAALHKKLGGREEYADYLHHIDEQVERLNALMNDLLALGRPIPIEAFAEVDLWDVVESAVEGLKVRFPGAKERVEVRQEGEIPKVVGARGNLLQVVENLLSNALSFSPEGEKVRVRLRAGNGEAAVEVEDRGPGIPADLLEKLFTPFSSRRKGGTGLGLAIVKKVVEAHGGEVTAVNNDPPPGAAFTVRLSREPLPGRAGPPEKGKDTG